MREFSESRIEAQRDMAAEEVLHETVREFHLSGVLGAYVAALDREAVYTQEAVLSRLARSEYPIVSRRVDYVEDAHPNNGRYFLAKFDPSTGDEIFAMAGDNDDKPVHIDTPDSLVWVCTVSPSGEVTISRNFTQQQAVIVMVQAQAVEMIGFRTRGRVYLELGEEPATH